MVSRSPMFGPTPRSPSTSEGRTPATSPLSPALSAYHLSVAAAAAAAAAKEDTFRAQASGPMEEEAVRKALGLPAASRVTGTAAVDGTGVAEESGRLSGLTMAALSDRDRDAGFPGGGGAGVGGWGGVPRASQAPGSAPLCLLLSNLGELFRWDTAAAADICADAFPGVRPW